MENWKQIKNYEGRYMISDLGNVMSSSKPHRATAKTLSPVNQSGYCAVDLGNGRTIKRHLVHRLVASAFIENPENKPQVNHINGKKNDNRLENLEWCTRSENQLHSIRIGLRTTKGVKNSQCKITQENVMSIFADQRKYKEICVDYGVSIPTISDIKRGYSWSHITGMENKKANRNQTLIVK